MKRIVVAVLLVVSVVFIGFILGGTIAKYFFVQPGDGLAAAGTAAVLALLGGGIGLVASLVLLRKLEENAKMILALSLFAVSLVLFGVFYYQFKQRQLEREKENAALFGHRNPSQIVSAVALDEASPNASNSELKLADGTEMGIGIVSIFPKDNKTLIFYSKPQLNAMREQAEPMDSLKFSALQNDHYYEMTISSAPPWFVPQHLKLDYEILQLVAVTARKNWLEVIVNKTNGKTAWIHREDVGFKLWPEFLLNVNSVELLNPADFPPRIKPMDHASPDESVDGNGIFYPVSVKDDWLQVHSDKEVNHDIWVRWKRDGILLVRYSMLS